MTATERVATYVPGGAEPLSYQVMTALAQHRMATSAQLHTLLRPDATRQALLGPLNMLRTQGFVDRVTLPSSGRSLAWYLTPEGARLTRDWPDLRGRPPYPITSTSAASLRTPHTLTAVRAHIAFVCQARERGDEHGHLDWTPEVAHSLGDGERIIADAVLHYTVRAEGERTKLRAFVEIDRATTSSERLATKLIDYARLHTYAPVPPGRRPAKAPAPSWQRWYPLFPRVLFILTAASERTLAHRVEDLQAMTAEHPAVAALARVVPLAAARLEELEEQGTSAPVWQPLAGGPRQAWTDL
ncbi:replication-relaxation family protein [Streptomyces sp. NBC_01500]|uniref:replication-relaxation family protein n=1 Tax=Streptomyces sp. NBC_01500 TaxID=2903886 RepID=UPI002259BE23|nr:replication-relaxation family protein [Streptomyces sp. NBC_01500]MCX4554230.1 replication-relaxation family protein [Streptomyces sp. NBC_01500]